MNLFPNHLFTKVTFVCIALFGLHVDSAKAVGTIGFQVSSMTVSQTAGAVSIPVEFIGTGGVWGQWADYESRDGTAIAGNDYSSVFDDIDLSSTNPVGYIAVPIIYTGSTVDRTFSVVLTKAYNANLGAITSVTVTIKAEPVRPPVVFNLGKTAYSVSQGAGAIQIPVSFTNSPRFSQVWIKYATQGNTATSGTDYRGTNSTTVNFVPGANTAVITIPIYRTGATSNRSFNVFLLSSSEGSIGSNSLATVTILGVNPVPKANILTTAGPVGIPFTIYGNVSNVKDSQIKSVLFTINGKKMKLIGKRNWKSMVVARSIGRYRMVVTVYLTNGKILRKTAYLSIT